MDLAGLTLVDVPEGWTALDAIAVIKALDDEGRVSYLVRATVDLESMEAMGMLHSAYRQQEAAVDAQWLEESE